MTIVQRVYGRSDTKESTKEGSLYGVLVYCLLFVKVTLCLCTPRSYTGEWSSTHSHPSHQMEANGKRRVPAALTGEKSPKYQLNGRLGGRGTGRMCWRGEKYRLHANSFRPYPSHYTDYARCSGPYVSQSFRLVSLSDRIVCSTRISFNG
jgi:hypothetical protein